MILHISFPKSDCCKITPTFITDGDPNNYLSYYRRATVYLALGRSRPGLQDLDEVVRLKPDFTAARAQRGGVLVKLGRLEEAHMDLENVVMCSLALYTILSIYNLITFLKTQS